MCIAGAAMLIGAGPAAGAGMFYIRGGGDGHGIGMSQYGARGYAQHGKDYRFILADYYHGTTLARTDPSRVVRVLLKTGSAAFSGASRAAGKRLDPLVTYTLGVLGDRSLILVDNSGQKVGRFTAPLTVTGPDPLRVAGLGRYRGALEFRPDGAGGVQTIDAVRLEDYVRGVISAEMPASWPPEALKAQAVAARTYAITTHVGGSGFDVYPDTRSQMYEGISAETSPTNAAVAATAGQVVTYHGVPVVTYFFASSGGHTENVENVWPGATPRPWLRGVRDPYDNADGDPYNRWGDDMTLATAASKLGGLVKGQLIGIQITQHGRSPRILSADVIGTGGHRTVTGTQLQRVFGLLSTDAAFTTTSTFPGHPPAQPQRAHRDARPASGQSKAQALATLLALIHDLMSTIGHEHAVPTAARPARAAIHGNVFPAQPGQSLTVQLNTSRGWRAILDRRLGPESTYTIELPGRGTYRIVYRGLDGPAVKVS